MGAFRFQDEEELLDCLGGQSRNIARFRFPCDQLRGKRDREAGGGGGGGKRGKEDLSERHVRKT